MWSFSDEEFQVADHGCIVREVRPIRPGLRR
jgi:hypothetical protein